MNVAWGAIFITGAVVTVLCLFFLWTRFCRFGIVQKIAGDRKWMRRLLGLVPMLIIGVFMVVSLVNTAIVMIHMSIVWLLAELVAWIVRKIRSRKSVKTDEKADVKPNEKAIKSGEKAAGKTAGKIGKWMSATSTMEIATSMPILASLTVDFWVFMAETLFSIGSSSFFYRNRSAAQSAPQALRFRVMMYLPQNLKTP